MHDTPPSPAAPHLAGAEHAPIALSIIIPMYQERARILATMLDTLGTLKDWALPAEVLLVDDGCTDATANVLIPVLTRPGAPVTARQPAVLLLDHAHNRGKGAAVRTGLLAARGAWVLMMDADNATRLRELAKLAPYTKDAPLIVGSRAAPDADVRTALHRRLAGRCFHAALTLLGLNTVRDTQCGFKLYRADLARFIARHAREDRFAFDVEHLLLARRASVSIREVGVAWEHRSGGTIRVGTDGLKMLRAAWAIKRRVASLPAVLPTEPDTQGAARVQPSRSGPIAAPVGAVASAGIMEVKPPLAPTPTAPTPSHAVEPSTP